ncbi:transposase [Streptacidiphilus sp. MAP12-16]
MVPAETVRVARAAFPKGSLAIRVRDELGVLFTDGQFADLFPARGKPAWSLGRLALVLVLQFVEGLTDRQAAEAVRGRIDFKYALGLELTDPGFDFSVLSEFRDRLVEEDAGRRVLDGILAAARDKDLLNAGGKARTDSTHVLSSARELCWLEMVAETLRAALNGLAATAPEWLVQVAGPEWFKHYASQELHHFVQPDSAVILPHHQVGKGSLEVVLIAVPIQKRATGTAGPPIWDNCWRPEANDEEGLFATRRRSESSPAGRHNGHAHTIAQMRVSPTHAMPVNETILAFITGGTEEPAGIGTILAWTTEVVHEAPNRRRAQDLSDAGQCNLDRFGAHAGPGTAAALGFATWPTPRPRPPSLRSWFAGNRGRPRGQRPRRLPPQPAAAVMYELHLPGHPVGTHRQGRSAAARLRVKGCVSSPG